MPKLTGITAPAAFLLCVMSTHAQVQSPAGKWISNLKFFEDNNYDRMEFELNGTKLTGKLGNDSFDGTFQDGKIEGTVKPNSKTTIQLHGRIDGDRINGTALLVE